MPVDFETHDRDSPRLDLSEGTNARALLEVLLQHPGVGFTPSELSAQTDVPRGSVGPTLKRLQNAGLVRHKEPYWAVAEDDRLGAATASILGLEAATESFSEDWYAENEGWAEDLPDLSDDEA